MCVNVLHPVTKSVATEQRMAPTLKSPCDTEAMWWWSFFFAPLLLPQHHHHPKRQEEGGGVHTMRSWMTQGGAGIVGGGGGNGYGRILNEEKKKWMRRRWREAAWADLVERRCCINQLPFFPSLLFTLLSVLPEWLCSFYFCHHCLRSSPYHILPFSSSFFLFIELFLLPSFIISCVKN